VVVGGGKSEVDVVVEDVVVLLCEAREVLVDVRVELLVCVRLVVDVKDVVELVTVDVVAPQTNEMLNAGVGKETEA